MFAYWLFLLVLVLVSALLMTWGVRRYALLHDVLDMPNYRSSHTRPTPRGGGVAIVLGFFLGLFLLFYLGIVAAGPFGALLGSGGLVALVGFLDDHRPIAVYWRLLTHFIAAVWALLWLGGVLEMQVAGISLGWLGGVAALLYLVWLLNLYNFMDGIDGIAGVEAVTVCLSGVLLYGLVGHWSAALIPALLAAAAAGFLFWNFPPARIFMGDAGSGFLGIVLGVLSLQAGWLQPQLFWAWFILLGVFIVDATLTLLRRLLRGERVYEAHRSHAYQFAVRHYGRHLPVTLGVGVINVLWLTPFAIWVALGGSAVMGVLLAYAPLLMLALKFRAGLAE
ncbi:MAG: MraY family glycosyltransferase [Pseudomonas sp.]